MLSAWATRAAGFPRRSGCGLGDKVTGFAVRVRGSATARSRLIGQRLDSRRAYCFDGRRRQWPRPLGELHDHGSAEVRHHYEKANLKYRFRLIFAADLY